MNGYFAIVITSAYLKDKVNGLTLTEFVKLFNDTYDKVSDLLSKYDGYFLSLLSK